jgi:uncharacterized RDD family membrane protein YckC
MSETGWYYDGGGQQVGPLGLAALVELIRAGRIAPGTRVWRPGLAGWAPWETVPDVTALVAPAPAGPPPLASPPATAPFSPNSHAAEVLAGGGAGAPYPKAPLGARFLAYLIDGLVSMAALLPLFAAIGAGTAGSNVLAAVFGVVAVVTTAWAIWYSFTKDGRPGGQSIGKKAMSLMVVHLGTNQPCTPGQSALRALILMLTNLLPYVGWLIEPIVLLAAAGGRRLGDQAAGTQVIGAADYRRQG